MVVRGSETPDLSPFGTTKKMSSQNVDRGPVEESECVEGETGS